jgi:hypothetical protein
MPMRPPILLNERAGFIAPMLMSVAQILVGRAASV